MHGVQNRMKTMSKSLDEVLAEWYPDGYFTEDELWEAVAESQGVDVNEISDRDLTEFI